MEINGGAESPPSVRGSFDFGQDERGERGERIEEG